MTQLPVGKLALGSKWVYKIKNKANRTIEWYKAYLVKLENTQQEGVDFIQTFAPITKSVTIRTLVSVTAAQNWSMHQMDVYNAFFSGELKKEVYM